MKCVRTLNKYGFTLIEIIVTIVIVASLSGIMIVLISDSLSSSSDPVLRLGNASELSMVIANINDDYYKCPVWTKGTIYAANSFVKPTTTNANGHYYKCTVPGTSNLSEPPWPTSGSIPDNTITWTETTEKGPLLSLQPDLKNKINDTSNNKYGMYYSNNVQKYVTYYVVSNAIVPTPPPGSTILKVTIADRYYGTGDRRSQMLTSYFISN